MSLEYWITRWSLSSAVALRRPGAVTTSKGYCAPVPIHRRRVARESFHRNLGHA
jgi:hypothetical protein